MNETPTDSIVFTEAAATKVGDLIREEGNPALKLRVYIQGGGCSGFQYGFEFDEQQNEDDFAVATDHLVLFGLCAACRKTSAAPGGQ